MENILEFIEERYFNKIAHESGSDIMWKGIMCSYQWQVVNSRIILNRIQHNLDETLRKDKAGIPIEQVLCLPAKHTRGHPRTAI